MCAAYFPREVCENPAFKQRITFYEWALYHTLRTLLILVPHLRFLSLTPLLNSKSKSGRQLLSDPRGRSFAALMLFVSIPCGSGGGRCYWYAAGLSHCPNSAGQLGGTGAQNRVAK